jgi:hypothetical protein
MWKQQLQANTTLNNLTQLNKTLYKLYKHSHNSTQLYKTIYTYKSVPKENLRLEQLVQHAQLDKLYRTWQTSTQLNNILCFKPNRETTQLWHGTCQTTLLSKLVQNLSRTLQNFKKQQKYKQLWLNCTQLCKKCWHNSTQLYTIYTTTTHNYTTNYTKLGTRQTKFYNALRHFAQPHRNSTQQKLYTSLRHSTKLYETL